MARLTPQPAASPSKVMACTQRRLRALAMSAAAAAMKASDPTSRAYFGKAFSRWLRSSPARLAFALQQSQLLFALQQS